MVSVSDTDTVLICNTWFAPDVKSGLGTGRNPAILTPDMRPDLLRFILLFDVIFYTVSQKRRKVHEKQTYIKLKTCKLYLESFEYFCQMSSKSILIISRCTVSKLTHF